MKPLVLNFVFLCCTFCIMVLHICKPNTTCVRSYSVCAHEPVCLLLFKIKMWVDLCILGVYRGFLFMYFTYLFTFITFVNEDVGGFVH